ncbi:hypothetical protein EJ08DRAFT_604117 [Tothia fuscella]|uniref:Uncharacterized protein n=1 Tax=Tothia fuscella TaxID=1048955 RepID=A0A9P4P0H6_9PEZI|nr:hypothetical protein EJ08DRAFT_604117 [Tothia fuscella]
MPTPGSAKGKGKSGRDVRRSGSRNTTPLSSSSVSAANTIEPTHAPYLQTPLSGSVVLSDTPIDDIFDGSSSSSNPPSANTLRAITESVKSQLLNTIKPRGEICDRMMRELHSKKKERVERNRQREQHEIAEREAEERRQKLKVTPKKREREEERPLAVGAHGIARQDGANIYLHFTYSAATSSSISSPASQPPPSIPDTNMQKQEPESPRSDATPHQPRPAPSVQQYQLFGDDPSEYPDDTVYDIREITPGMTEEEIKAIYCVTGYPDTDLHDKTPGTPPDRDFSNAKPSNQVTATTFSNYVEPFIRPLTEEDRGFLLERGDREKPFVIPKRGLRPYKDVWAEEDGILSLELDAGRFTDNIEPHGTMDDMNDAIAETDNLCPGPVLSRIMSAMRPERSNASNVEPIANGFDMEIDGAPSEPSKPAEPPATQFSESSWKNVPQPPRQDYSQVDDRIVQELKFLAFLAPTETPDFASGADDEVAARLRYLQGELRRASIINGARKAALLEVTENWMAKQEYTTIADDLDNQLNQAYLKRNRNIGKKGKQIKRPGGAGGGSHVVGVARPGTAAATNHAGIGEPIKNLMDRKKKWNEWIGPVVDYGKTSIPKETIFPKETIERLCAKEQETWAEEQE